MAKNNSAQDNQPAEERLEDVFPEIVKRFADTQSFMMFAESSYGLGLDHDEVMNIKEDNPVSLQILWKWAERPGSKATPENIRQIVSNYFNEEKGQRNSRDEVGDNQDQGGRKNIKAGIYMGNVRKVTIDQRMGSENKFNEAKPSWEEAEERKNRKEKTKKKQGLAQSDEDNPKSSSPRIDVEADTVISKAEVVHIDQRRLNKEKKGPRSQEESLQRPIQEEEREKVSASSEDPETIQESGIAKNKAEPIRESTESEDEEKDKLQRTTDGGKVTSLNGSKSGNKTRQRKKEDKSGPEEEKKDEGTNQPNDVERLLSRAFIVLCFGYFLYKWLYE